MAANKEVALRKRQQIDSSKKTMLISVAVAAFVSGIALVVAYFLVQQIWFHSKIIGAKQETLSTIRDNITTTDKLKDNIRVLETNQALNSVKASDSSSALQVILDALPADANADALGASLQVKFSGAVDGLKIESLTVDSVGGDQASGTAATTTEDNSADSSSSIGFRMSVSGSAEGLKNLLARFEKSIRVIDLTSIEVQAGDGQLTMNIIGRAYYEPSRTIELGTKVVKP